MASKKPTPSRGRVWMQVPMAADVEVLRTRIAANGPLWDRWEYKLHRDRIIIYDVLIPIGDEAERVGPSPRALQPHLRVGPYPDGPFELEWMRHTGRWFPLYVTGTIEHIADAIAGGKVPMTGPMDQFDYERQQTGK